MVSFLQDINYKGPSAEDCKKQCEIMEAVGNTEGPLYKLLKMRSTQDTPKPEPRPARPHFGIKPGRKCKFCKNNGESKDQFSSHVLRNPNTGKLICPVLRSHICEMCGATGKVIYPKYYINTQMNLASFCFWNRLIRQYNTEISASMLKSMHTTFKVFFFHKYFYGQNKYKI